MIRTLSWMMVATLVGASPAVASDGALNDKRATPIQTGVRIEIARLVAAQPAVESSTAGRQPSPGRRNWVQRHPVLTGAMVGFGSGFLIGYLPGDDAVFDDFVAGFNGTVVGGIGAGAGASIVAIVQALRKPLNP
jgi:hypothetical protein